MIKRIPWKGILTGFIWTLCLAGLVVSMSFIDTKKDEVTCQSLKVYIPGEQQFVTRAEVERILRTTGGEWKGKLLYQINTQALEDALEHNPFIKEAKVYADMTGTLSVRVVQREPLLRIFNAKNQDFYIDKDGYKIPVSLNFTAEVLVATGAINEDLEGMVRKVKTPMGKDLYKMALFIAQDTLWSNQIQQLYVNSDSDIQLVPKVGDHQIIVGNADSLETKFNKLMVFYKQALPKLGWNTYKSINLKFSKQIICTKSGAVEAPKAPVEPIKTDTTAVSH